MLHTKNGTKDTITKVEKDIGLAEIRTRNTNRLPNAVFNHYTTRPLLCLDLKYKMPLALIT